MSKTITTFRAAFWTSADGQSEILLTDESQSDLSDGDLMDAAKAELDSIGWPSEPAVDESGAEICGADEVPCEGEIVIGEWTR